MQLYRFEAHGRKIGALTANCDLSAAHNAPKAGEKPNSPAAPPTTPMANLLAVEPAAVIPKEVFIIAVVEDVGRRVLLPAPDRRQGSRQAACSSRSIDAKR
jgi:hypothetical protein